METTIIVSVQIKTAVSLDGLNMLMFILSLAFSTDYSDGNFSSKIYEPEQNGLCWGLLIIIFRKIDFNFGRRLLQIH